MNRQERREYAKRVAKGEISLSSGPKNKLMPNAIIADNGQRFTDVSKYIDYMEQETAKRSSKIASELLYDSEIYMCVSVIITMLIATEMSVGHLKTVQKSYQKILDHFNEAADYVDKVGVREAYEGLREDYGIQLDFEECDLNWVDDDGKEVYGRLKVRI